MRISDWSSDVCSSDLWPRMSWHTTRAGNHGKSRSRLRSISCSSDSPSVAGSQRRTRYSASTLEVYGRPSYAPGRMASTAPRTSTYYREVDGKSSVTGKRWYVRGDIDSLRRNTRNKQLNQAK